jgi:uncharacterized protein with von Willebrand factor type A (vWA) domain
VTLKGKAHTEYRKMVNVKSQQWADNTWQPWTEEEIAYLLESDEKLTEIAKRLGRTYKGCLEKRKKIRREQRRRNELDSKRLFWLADQPGQG